MAADSQEEALMTKELETVNNPTDELKDDTDEQKDINDEETEEKLISTPNTATNIPAELLPPSKSLQDIYCDPADADPAQIKEALKQAYQVKKEMTKKNPNWFQSKPSMILSNWLFLGNSRNAFNLPCLKQLGITHILNVTREVTKYHILNTEYPIKYAQLSIDDHMFNPTHSIYDYFSACKEFIDECNPAINGGDHDKKILVHCAAGKSRSSTIIISYLMTSIINMTEIEQNRMKHIRECLNDEKWIHETKHDMKILLGASFTLMDKIEENLNETQREKLIQLRQEKYDERYLNLAEAYYYTKSCRELISPNFSFCGQLKRLEKLYQNGKKSTLCDIPSFTEWDNDTMKVWKECAQKYPIQYPIDQVIDDESGCSCVIL